MKELEHNVINHEGVRYPRYIFSLKKHMIRFGNTRKLVKADAEGIRDNLEISDHYTPAPTQPRASNGKVKGTEVLEYTFEDAGGESSAATGMCTETAGILGNAEIDSYVPS
jgi:hypothetical protein